MKKLILKFGVIAGLIVAALMLGSLPFKENFNLVTGMIYGYTTMLIAFSMIYVAIRQYRDQHLGGSISFRNAFLIGLGITLIASVFYVVAWEIEYRYFIPDFIEEYGRQTIDQLKASGAPAAEIAKTTKEMDDYAVQYKNPAFRIPVTFTEILPVGLLISVICAFILKRNPKS